MARKKKNLGLLPDHFCIDDDQWLSEKLSRFSYPERAAVCRAYSKVYQEAYEGEEREIRRENAARRAANLRLIKYIARS